MATQDASLLRRAEAAAALNAAGFPITRATLETIAVRGGGPPFRKFGRTVLYRRDELLAWAEARLSGPVRSTSERPNVAA